MLIKLLCWKSNYLRN